MANKDETVLVHSFWNMIKVYRTFGCQSRAKALLKCLSAGRVEFATFSAPRGPNTGLQGAVCQRPNKMRRIGTVVTVP